MDAPNISGSDAVAPGQNWNARYLFGSTAKIAHIKSAVNSTPSYSPQHNSRVDSETAPVNKEMGRVNGSDRASNCLPLGQPLHTLSPTFNCVQSCIN